MHLENLTPNTSYYIRPIYRGEVPGEVTEVKTCPTTAVPYGDMESWREYSRTGVGVGTAVFMWDTKISVTGYYPDNDVWSCVNQKTLESTPNVKSTYNIIESTYRDTGRSGYAAVLRTVGWDNGTGNANLTIYHISAGKLFIGSYSYNHSSNTESYDYGMEYVSRPTQMQFYCKYSPYNSDSFKTIIVLENRTNGVVSRIGYGEYVSGSSLSSFTQVNVNITYDDTYYKLPITHMYILFSSSAKYSDDESTETTNLKGMVSNGNYHTGSVLTIDDISLIYDK
jgi:hypothetical protein